MKVKYLTHEDFYKSKRWWWCKNIIKSSNEIKCLKCGSRNNMHVDHVKPKSKFPELALDVYNLQLLCEVCNIEKSNINEIDYRDSDFIQNITEYLETNGVNYELIVKKYVISKFVFEYPKGYVTRKKIKLKKKIKKTKKTNATSKTNKKKHKKHELDPKLDIEKILKLQKGEIK